LHASRARNDADLDFRQAEASTIAGDDQIRLQRKLEPAAESQAAHCRHYRLATGCHSFPGHAQLLEYRVAWVKFDELGEICTRGERALVTGDHDSAYSRVVGCLSQMLRED